MDKDLNQIIHDLKKPATVTKSYLSMVIEQRVGPISPKIKNYIQIAYQSNENLIELINQLKKHE